MQIFHEQAKLSLCVTNILKTLNDSVARSLSISLKDVYLTLLQTPTMSQCSSQNSASSGSSRAPPWTKSRPARNTWVAHAVDQYRAKGRDALGTGSVSGTTTTCPHGCSCQESQLIHCLHKPKTAISLHFKQNNFSHSHQLAKTHLDKPLPTSERRSHLCQLP